MLARKIKALGMFLVFSTRIISFSPVLESGAKQKESKRRSNRA